MRTAHVVCTTAADGDFNADVVEPQLLVARQRSVVDLAWSWLDEVHGTDVIVVHTAGEHRGTVGDALITGALDAPIAVWVGDCAPVALIADDVVGVAHAGWRGLLGGVLGATVEAMRRAGAGTITATVGPVIGPCCYEFGPEDLDIMAARFGDVRSTTSWGTPALSMPACLRAALAEHDVVIDSIGECTGCAPDRFWSHRARQELQRQAMVVWMTEDR